MLKLLKKLRTNVWFHMFGSETTAESGQPLGAHMIAEGSGHDEQAIHVLRPGQVVDNIALESETNGGVEQSAREAQQVAVALPSGVCDPAEHRVLVVVLQRIHQKPNSPPRPVSPGPGRRLAPTSIRTRGSKHHL